jgi:hypothetical protein
MLDSIVDTAQGSNKQYVKNQYAFDLELIFSNLDFVKQQLGEWHYSKGHYSDQ